MAKYCKPMGLKVTYLDCMECEGKECKQMKQEGTKVLHKCYLRLEPNQECFMVYCSEKEGNSKTIIVKCSVRECIVRSNETLYILVPVHVVSRRKDFNMERNYICKNSTIDTGIRDKQKDIYPVFTTKEKCMEWLKG